MLEYVTGTINPARNHPITLVIDIKTNANNTYRELAKLLEKYSPILSVHKDGQLTIKNVTIVITGHKPMRLLESPGEHFAFIDEDLRKAGKDTLREIYPMASCKYSTVLKWKGKGILPENEKQRLQLYVEQAHKLGSKVRLWGSPENKIVWEELLQCNVDLINTDKISALHKFLVNRLSLMAVAQ